MRCDVQRSRARQPSRRGWKKKLVLSAAVLLLALAVPEIALRMAGWSRQPGIQFGYPRPSGFAAFEVDPELFWKLAPRDRARGAQVHAPGNSLGFPGPEIELPKRAGTFRMLFLGDSCTYLGYPREVAAGLARADPTRRYEAVVLAIPGYSSHQGRIVAERHGARLEADLAFVYYGWNDHWQAYGAIDAEKVVRVPHSALARIARDSRLVQATQAVREWWTGATRPLERPRVPPESYRDNLRAIVAVFRASGVPVAVITAPTSFYRAGVPRALVELAFVPDAETAVARHRAYNQIARDVAAECGTELVDLERECEAREDAGGLFGADGIHFSEQGKAWIAGRLAEFVASRGAR